jgi:GNAT superfamily N-acetyltransferase
MTFKTMDLSVLRTKLDTLGPSQAVAYYLYQGVNRLVPIDLVRGFCLTPADAGAPRPAQGNERCRLLSPDEVMRETQGAASGIIAEDAAANLALGEECFGVYVDGNLASHAWYSGRACALRSGIHVRFDPRYAYSRWAFTRPEYRGRGLHALGKRHALEHYAARGRLGVLSTVKVANFESLHSAKRQGSHPVGFMLAASVGGRNVLWASAGCRAYGMGLETVAAVRSGPGE